MKNLVFNVFSLFVTFALLASCQQAEVEMAQETLKSVDSYQTLAQAQPLEEGIELPKGTQWKYTDASQTSVEFVLPQGYSFLLQDKETKAVSLAPTGGYSCTCSASGSCTVVFNNSVGYGCLSGTCTGKCTGQKTKGLKSNLEILGVLYTAQDDISYETAAKASLSTAGKAAFAQLPELQKLIQEHYDFLYGKENLPDFPKGEDLVQLSGEDYALAQSYFYGQAFQLLIPYSPDFSVLFPDVKLTAPGDAPKSCSCTSGEGKGCALKKVGKFGYYAYYCTGCTTCTMND